MPRQKRSRTDRTEQPDTDVPHILATLKDLFAARGIRYAEIAAALGVSEASVKRYLAGRGLSLQILEQICKILGMRLSELADVITIDQDRKTIELSREQEYGLAQSPFTAFVFYMLRCGWSSAEIRAEFGLDESEMVLHLTRLDRLRLIDLLPNNRLRLLTIRYPHWRDGGPMRRLFDRFVKHKFASMDYHDPDVLWGLETVKLSGASLVHLKDMINAFSDEVLRLAESDRKLGHTETNWYSVLLAARPFEPAELREPMRG